MRDIKLYIHYEEQETTFILFVEPNTSYQNLLINIRDKLKEKIKIECNNIFICYDSEGKRTVEENKMKFRNGQDLYVFIQDNENTVMIIIL